MKATRNRQRPIEKRAFPHSSPQSPFVSLHDPGRFV